MGSTTSSRCSILRNVAKGNLCPIRFTGKVTGFLPKRCRNSPAKKKVATLTSTKEGSCTNTYKQQAYTIAAVPRTVLTGKDVTREQVKDCRLPDRPAHQLRFSSKALLMCLCFLELSKRLLLTGSSVWQLCNYRTPFLLRFVWGHTHNLKITLSVCIEFFKYSKPSRT